MTPRLLALWAALLAPLAAACGAIVLSGEDRAWWEPTVSGLVCGLTVSVPLLIHAWALRLAQYPGRARVWVLAASGAAGVYATALTLSGVWEAGSSLGPRPPAMLVTPMFAVPLLTLGPWVCLASVAAGYAARGRESAP